MESKFKKGDPVKTNFQVHGKNIQLTVLAFDKETIVCVDSDHVQWFVNESEISPSPTPQVQSGLSADEVLNKYQPNCEYPSYYHESDASDAMEEYAASKVAEEKFKNEELREQVNDLEDNLEKEQKAGSEWARLAVEAGNQRSRYQSKVAEKEREIERLKQELEENIKMSKVWKDAYEKAHKDFWGLV